MKKLTFAALVLMVTSVLNAQIADYSDFTGYAIRNGTSGGFVTGVVSNDTAQTFTATAVGGGKVAIGTTALNGHKISDFMNFKFSNSVAVPDNKIVYPNFWLTDNAGHYAFVAFHSVSGGTQSDTPVYNAMTSTDGMSKAFFDDLAIRIYAANTSSFDWIFGGCVKQAKKGGWTTSLWKSATATTFDPVKIADIQNLYFGSPFTNATVPGIANNPAYTFAGTGDPQVPASFFMMMGDTTGTVTGTDYTLSNIQLQYIPEPASMCLLGLGSLLFARNRK